MWVVKYKPKFLKEFVNQNEALRKFLNFIKKWKKGKALLFYGPPGTGKTCLIEAYANEKNLEFIELNASDWRSKTQIEKILSETINTKPLFKKGKIIFIDEIDGLAGREDVGGVGAIIKLIKESRFPIILTANDPWKSKLKILRNYCELIEFKKVSVFDIEKRLMFIARKENIKVDKIVLRELARRSEGDLRAAITDLEIVSRGKNEIRLKDLEVLGFREKEKIIFDVLKNIFKTSSARSASLALMNVDKDPAEIFWWIEENILNEYEKAEEIAKAYEALSKADLFRARITREQNWKFLKYMIELMTAGVALSKKEMYRKFTRYKYPSKLIVLGRTKFERREEKEKLLELSKELHCSTRKIRKEFLPFLKIFMKD